MKQLLRTSLLCLQEHISQPDWQAIQATLYLLSIPNMRKSIKEGLDTPIEEGEENLDW